MKGDTRSLDSSSYDLKSKLLKGCYSGDYIGIVEQKMETTI